MDCPYCKAPNRDGVRFCSNCGRQMPGPNSGGISNQPSTITTTATVPAVRGGSGSIAIGTPLQGGRYIIKDVLGQGGMGAALLATDKRLDNKQVVIKELVSESTDAQKLRDDEANFKREVVTLAHLDHPLIPNVTDNFEEGSRFFMVQEYVEGENLEEHMDHLKQPMKERDALMHASEILDVLDYLSRQTPPIVHRDIKPANIVIGSKDKRAHLVDFGIARADVARNAKRKQTSALGTPGYAPPEQYQGNADPRSDLYALGATLHHLLTNRDPRNYPPFNFPAVRTINSQLSVDVERLLTRVLHNDINQRYQSAAAMKHDVDEILYNRFGISSGALSYSASGAMAAVTAPNATTTSQPQNPLPNPVTPPIAPASSLPPQRNRRLAYVLLILIILIGAGYGILEYARSHGTITASTATPTAPAATSTPLPPIGVTKLADGEYIGISDGTFAFDQNGGSLSLNDYALKQQAAAALKSGNTSQAETLFNQAITQQSNDAEAQIYLEDQRVLANSSFHVTIIVATMLTGSDSSAIGVGFDDLQGAYVAQKKYNDQALLNGVGVVLLIANAGSSSANAPIVARQMVRAAQADPTIVGVMGWPYSSYVSNTYAIFQAAHLPMVSQTASSDLLTGLSPYLFRVCPTNKAEGVAGADYTKNHLNAQNIILFTDPLNAYTSSLATDFSAQFRADGGNVISTRQYTVGNSKSVLSALQAAIQAGTVPDAIYFSGYAGDLSVLMTSLAQSKSWPQVQIIGGDGFYQLHSYQSSSRPLWNRLHFTAFAYPDAWYALGYGSQRPDFFTDYATDFDPQNKQPGIYGWSRTDNDVMLSYDAMLALLNAAKNTGKTQIAATDEEQALTQLNGPRAFQGVSGQIALGTNGDPINKAVIFLNISPEGYITMQDSSLSGQFLLQ